MTSAACIQYSYSETHTVPVGGTRKTRDGFLSSTLRVYGRHPGVCQIHKGEVDMDSAMSGLPGVSCFRLNRSQRSAPSNSTRTCNPSLAVSCRAGVAKCLRLNT